MPDPASERRAVTWEVEQVGGSRPDRSRTAEPDLPVSESSGPRHRR